MAWYFREHELPDIQAWWTTAPCARNINYGELLIRALEIKIDLKTIREQVNVEVYTGRTIKFHCMQMKPR